MKHFRYLTLLLIVTLAISGCAPSVTYVIDVTYAPKINEQSPGQTEPLRIAVIPFEDARENKKGIGTRLRLTGRTDEFEARPYPASTAVTETLVSALKIQGYQPVVIPRGKDYTGITDGSSLQVILSGKIEELWAEAISKPGFTDIKTKV